MKTDESFYDLDDGSFFSAMFRESVAPDFVSVPEFTDTKLDELFIEWLKKEDRDFDEDESYSRKVSCECEHFCLFFLMTFGGEDYSVRLGNFNCNEHYWIVRNSDGLVIDGTLQQFKDNVPAIACSYPTNRNDGYSWLEDCIESGIDYLERNEAWEFYTHPLTGFIPEKKLAVDKIFNDKPWLS